MPTPGSQKPGHSRMPNPTFPIAIVAHALSENARLAPRLARQAGFAGLQFDAFDPSVNFHELSGTGRRDFRHALAAQDQKLVALRVDVGGKGLVDSANLERVLARLSTAMESAAALGPKLLSVDLGPLPAVEQAAAPTASATPGNTGAILLPTAADLALIGAAPSAGSQGDPRGWSLVEDALRELGRRADRLGVTLAMRSELAALVSLDRAIRTGDCPWFGLDLDPVAILRDEWDLDRTFSRLGPVIRHVRGRDALAAQRRTQPAPMGKGSVDWEQVLVYLDDADYHGWITVDPLELSDRAGAARAGLEHLRA